MKKGVDFFDRYFLAADGGGSKTDMALYDARGKPIASLSCSRSAYIDMGVERAAFVLGACLDSLLKEAGVERARLAGAAFCLSSVGESPEKDEALHKALKTLCPNALMVNDSLGALYAAHAGKPGIVIVSGTGSIAAGLDETGNAARCGGYSPLFSDEGSSFWFGYKLMELYAKQDDGRLKRGPLHEVVGSALGVKNAYQLMSFAERASANDRAEIAALQPLAQQAAEKGDEDALTLYEQAACELALLALGVLGRLRFQSTDIRVCCMGGTFRAGALLLEPLERRLSEKGCVLVPPALHAPVQGAFLLCCRAANIPVTPTLLKTLRA